MKLNNALKFTEAKTIKHRLAQAAFESANGASGGNSTLQNESFLLCPENQKINNTFLNISNIYILIPSLTYFH